MASNALSVRVYAPKLGRLAQQFQTRFGAPALNAFLVAELQKLSSFVAGKIIKTQLSGGAGIKRRTGTLARSIIGVAQIQNTVPTLKVGVFRGPALSYAASLDQGATIVPKKAKALAIPTKDGGALTPAGVDRYGGPRQFPEPLKFIPFRSAKPNVVGGLFKTRGQDLILVYILLSKVKIEARRYLRKGTLLAAPEVASRLLASFAQRLRVS